MTFTALQLRDEPEIRTSLVHGVPAAVVQGDLGQICLFAPGHLVAYLVETELATRLYLFRTHTAKTDPATVVPGVHPAVNLLLETRNRTAARRACNLLRQLPTKGYEPEHLSDAFWLRLAGILTGRRPARAATVPALLARESGRVAV